MGYVYVGNAVIYTYPCQIFSQLYHSSPSAFRPNNSKKFHAVLLLQYQENDFFWPVANYIWYYLLLC